MPESVETRWTIEELGREVEAALSVDYAGPANGQIRAIPNARAIRYYTTLGLLDRPGEMRGRTALYGRRHLLQLVAIKRLQASGASLGNVQAQLGGLDDARLAAIARLPAPQRIAGPRRRPVRDDFWRAMPADAAPAERSPSAELVPATPEPVQLTQVELAPGVTLSFVSERAAGVADARSLAQAAEPLLRELELRGLVRPH